MIAVKATFLVRNVFRPLIAFRLGSRLGRVAFPLSSTLLSGRTASPVCLCRLLEIIHRFELGSGANFNTSKTKAMWLGCWRSQRNSLFGLKWVPRIKILGVYFSNGLLSVESDNWCGSRKYPYPPRKGFAV